MPVRRTVLASVLAVALTPWMSGAAFAQAWPNKPIRLVTAFGAGSASDIVARMIAEELQGVLKQTVVVENKPGASGMLAAENVARSPADGYTFFLSTNTVHSVNPHLFKKLPYEPLTDFTPVARVCYFPFVLAVNANQPVKSVPELIALGRQPGSKLSYAYGNSTGQIAGAAFTSLTKMDAAAVPYKSTPQALTDLIGGQVGFLFVDLASSAVHLKAGRLRMLAVTSEQKSALAPDLPTMAAAANLPGFDLSAWVGVLAPAGLPADIGARVGDVIVKMLGRKEVAEKLAGMGADVAPANGAELDRTMRSQLVSWGRKVKDAGIQPE